MFPCGLCAPNTIVVDFAYDEGHPLRLGNYPMSKHSSLASDSEFYDDPQYESYSSDEINLRAVALFDFTPENDNEVPLKEGQEIWVSYRHGQGWLVAEDPETGENGLVPEEYVEIIAAEEPEEEPQRFIPHILQGLSSEEECTVDSIDKSKGAEDEEWEDTEDEEETNTDNAEKEKLDSNGHSAHALPSLETKLQHMDVK